MDSIVRPRWLKGLSTYYDKESSHLAHQVNTESQQIPIPPAPLYPFYVAINFPFSLFLLIPLLLLFY